MAEVILCNLSDANEEIREARLYWTYEVLLAAGVPEDTITLDNIHAYKAEMDELGIEVEFIDGKLIDIYKLEWHATEYEAGWLPPTTEHLIAQWKEPERIVKIDEDKSAYYEIHLNSWSMFG